MTGQPAAGLGNNYRLEHPNDIVPQVPFNPPYYHPSPGYDIIKPTGQTPTANDITINPGISASEIGFKLDTSQIGPAHQWYIQNVTGCYAEDVPAAQQVGIPNLSAICAQYHLGC
jgi:hypothetical protein